MSYFSVQSILAERGLTIDDATEEQAEEVLVEAIRRDLPLGYATYEELANEVKQTGQRVVRVKDPSTPEAQQGIRIASSTIAMLTLSHHFGVCFAHYNCHTPVGAPDEKDVKVTVKEQLKLQNGTEAPQHC